MIFECVTVTLDFIIISKTIQRFFDVINSYIKLSYIIYVKYTLFLHLYVFDVNETYRLKMTSNSSEIMMNNTDATLTQTGPDMALLSNRAMTTTGLQADFRQQALLLINYISATIMIK